MNKDKADAGVPQEPDSAVTTEPQAPDAAEFAAETARAARCARRPGPGLQGQWLRAEAEIRTCAAGLRGRDAVRVSVTASSPT
jgi:hypothetical protein